MADLHRNCPVCDADATKLHWRKDELTLVRCSDCGMIFANPVPEPFVTGAFYEERSASYYLSPEKLASDYAAVRFERELKLFREFCPGGDVLDVGCSTGGFLFQLLSLPMNRVGGASVPASRYRVTGLDVAGPALDHVAGRGLEVLRAPFLEHDFGARRFDAITFWAVLEHLAEPRKFLQHAATLLRPGGFCFVLVPNLNSLAVRLLGARYRYVTPEHLNYFTRATLLKLAASVRDLKPVALRSTHFNPVVIGQDWRRQGGPVPDADRARLLAHTTRMKQSIWLKPAKLAYAGLEKGLGVLGLADNLVLVLRKE
ncbi:MAG: class I SAM-dependent methyltransferase [Verrucomicrobia bacterium]|nr:class I SAM-dependent methyltransferase [Verrucomicrobiota bacterium]